MVELLLILPIFLLMVFLIMEIGMLSYQFILAHHATFEVARICSLIAAPRVPGEDYRDTAELKDEAKRLFSEMMGKPRKGSFNIKEGELDIRYDTAESDPQSPDIEYKDLIVSAVFNAKYFFPFSSVVLGGGESGTAITVTMKMPVGVPLWAK
ncbi:MAG: TadE/TadG family type IV pilus assembly protein [Elusimicrobiaceae bacterium]